MALPETYASLTRTPNRHPLTETLVQPLRGLFGRTAKVPVGQVEPQLADSLLAALEGMTADHWPEAVFALDSVE